MRTPNGRYLGGKRSSPDASDLRFLTAHPDALLSSIPPSMIFSDILTFPPVDQGNIGSCGACSGQAILNYAFPPFVASILDIYWLCRNLEGTNSTDSGVETRDVFKILCSGQVIDEALWPYDTSKIFIAPPTPQKRRSKLDIMSRIVSEQELFSCLAAKEPFICGFEVYDSFDDNQTALTGVMKIPDTKREPLLGGHDVACFGYDLNFKNNYDFKKSGIDPALVSDQALYIRNSWGRDWGLSGYFWMPIVVATNPGFGNDNWTGRASAKLPQARSFLGVTIEGTPV